MMEKSGGGKRRWRSEIREGGRGKNTGVRGQDDKRSGEEGGRIKE